MTAAQYNRTSAANERGGVLEIKAQWLWQVVLGLIIFASSGAGYYSQSIYVDYFRTGAVAANATTEGNSLTFIGTLASIAVILMLPLYSFRKTPAVLIGFFLFQLYIVISGFWSFVPKETILSVIKTCVYTMALATLIQRMSYRSIVTSIALTAIVISLISLYLSYTNPIFSISLGTPGWRGLFAHKNRLAGFCLFMIVLLAPAYYLNVRKRLALATVGLLGLTAILSQGKTAVAATIGFIIASACLTALTRRKGGLSFLYKHSTLVLLFILTIIVPFVLIIVVEGDVTFTGRVETWMKFLSLTTDNRFLGMGGYTISSDPAFSALATMQTGAPTPDSSLVLLLCNLGILGIVLYLAFLGWCWRETLQSFSTHSLFSLFTILIYVIYGAMESDAQLGLSLSTVALLGQILISRRLFEGSRAYLLRQKAGGEGRYTPRRGEPLRVGPKAR